MSLTFIGSYTPERPIVIDSGSRGDGTPYPISFKRYPGTTSANDDICKCQWRLNKAKVECEGSVTVKFFDPAGIAPPEDRTVLFTLSDEGTATVTGSNCSVRLPTNITTGDGAVITGTDNDSIPVTLPWGPGSIGVAMQFNVGGGSGGTLGITDTTFLEYWKGIDLQFTAGGVNPGGTAGGLLVDTLNVFGGSLMGVRADVFHDTAALYLEVHPGAGDASVTFTTFKLTATDYLPVP